MKGIGLVLEGGGMRGVYTAGVLQFFMEKELYIPYVIGVSAGACNGSSYISKQKERNKMTNIDYITHPDYISYRRFFQKRELFGMDFLFHDLPMKHVPFNFEAFIHSEQRFVVGTTDCHTGQAVYYDKDELNKDLLTILRASSSLPFVAPMVEFQGKTLLDGGISDPIPLKKSEQDGNKRNIVILTRNEGYVKKKSSMFWVAKQKLKGYEGLADSLYNRYRVYNETVTYMEQKEREGNVFILRPKRKLEVGRVERNPERLEALYNEGYNDAKEQFEPLSEWLNK
ncbi:patatin-like phospholipase family protein [Priestia taiwanensis]|uniref:Patatin family protein n=1 Tax=Priestia taiwanensis TaxID=1347902 RepID=A0A917ATR6_9BACI|nr:patatin family protein [Priestia taiwanensis]MBM7364325.1 putative patatin/cPLA2 family phospholipase [Priestia taiwanensis]GGE73515.1 patatin family protein [Priestia taiwanensis]